jgi:hypothetical protein
MNYQKYLFAENVNCYELIKHGFGIWNYVAIVTKTFLFLQKFVFKTKPNSREKMLKQF